MADVAEQLRVALDGVQGLDADRILRALLSAVQAVLRTNAYQRGDDGELPRHLSFKLDPAKIAGMPEPAPAYEIWVYSPRVEGVHLRFGAVARGGLRWSDRREDFRTEVLGLVKAQIVKNAVIVPTGAKGGFVGKRLPDPAVDRDAWRAEGIACYRTFISALLDVTDDLRAGTTPSCRPPSTSSATTATTRTSSSPPTRGPRRSPTSPTRSRSRAASGSVTPSPPAARTATTTRPWASPPAARGRASSATSASSASTRRRTDITVVGVGDMSGDVFGNGMLLSEHIRLVAAFDHRHVFLDPDPDAAVSFRERQRLFALPRSSWADYDPALISRRRAACTRARRSRSRSARRCAVRLGLPEGAGR